MDRSQKLINRSSRKRKRPPAYLFVYVLYITKNLIDIRFFSVKDYLETINRFQVIFRHINICSLGASGGLLVSKLDK